MQRIKEFLQGKKTYLSAALIALVAVFGWWTGVLNDTYALALLGVAGTSAGLGAKSQRTAEAVLAALGDIRQVQAKTAVGQKIDPKQFAADLSRQLMAQFAVGGLVRSTPGGMMSNVVTGNSAAAQTCIYCGLPIAANNTVCTDPKNISEPDTVGNRHHTFLVAGSGSAAK
jgi:hypothetical protein